MTDRQVVGVLRQAKQHQRALVVCADGTLWEHDIVYGWLRIDGYGGKHTLPGSPAWEREKKEREDQAQLWHQNFP